jgi:hypothetical protein
MMEAVFPPTLRPGQLALKLAGKRDSFCPLPNNENITIILIARIGHLELFSSHVGEHL